MIPEAEQYLEQFRNQVASDTWGHRKLCLQRFSDFLVNNGIHLKQIKPLHFDLFAQHIALTVFNVRREPVGRARVQRHLLEVRPFLRYLFDRQLLLKDPGLQLGRLPRLKWFPKSVPTYGQVLQLMALPDLDHPAGLRDRAMFETAYGCGLRLAELHQLTLGDLDFEAHNLLVRRGKGGKRRQLPLGRVATRYLQLYLRDARPKLLKGIYSDLWINRWGRPYVQKQSLVTRMVAYERQLDFHLSWHSLRHAFATHLLEGGASIRAVQSLLGHDRLTTTEIYTRVRPVVLKRVHRECHPRG